MSVSNHHRPNPALSLFLDFIGFELICFIISINSTRYKDNGWLTAKRYWGIQSSIQPTNPSSRLALSQRKLLFISQNFGKRPVSLALTHIFPLFSSISSSDQHNSTSHSLNHLISPVFLLIISLSLLQSRKRIHKPFAIRLHSLKSSYFSSSSFSPVYFLKFHSLFPALPIPHSQRNITHDRQCFLATSIIILHSIFTKFFNFFFILRLILSIFPIPTQCSSFPKVFFLVHSCKNCWSKTTKIYFIWMTFTFIIRTKKLFTKNSSGFHYSEKKCL